MRFSNYYAQWSKERDHLAPSTLKDYNSIAKNYLLPALGSKQVWAIKSSHVQRIVESASPGRRKRITTLVSQLLPDVKVGRIGGSPYEVRRVPSVEEVEAVAVGHYAPLIKVAAFSGLRWGELAALRRSDVNLDTRTISVTKSWCSVSYREKAPKSRAGVRTVAYLPECHTSLIREVSRDSELLFTMPHGGRLHSSNFHKQHWQRQGVDFTFHDLRHTYATLLLERGVPIHLASRMLGHSNPSVTLNIYAGVIGDAAQTVARLVA